MRGTLEMREESLRVRFPPCRQSALRGALLALLTAAELGHIVWNGPLVKSDGAVTAPFDSWRRF